MKKSVNGVLSFLCLSFLISCQPSKTVSELPHTKPTGIMNGRNVKEGEKVGRSVVAIWDSKEKFICTGSLLENNVVITAAHCMVSRPAVLKVIFSLAPEEIVEAREPDILPMYSRHVTSYRVHEHYADAMKNKDEWDHADIAVLKFDGEVPDGYAPATMLTDVKELTKRTMVTLVGYGVSEIETPEFDIGNKSEEELDELESEGEILCNEDYSKCQSIEMGGDGTLKVAQAPIAELLKTEVRLDETRQGTCSGDSGGPAYLEKNGIFYLFGITSRGDALCTEGVYTNILSYTSWVADAIKNLK